MNRSTINKDSEFNSKKVSIIIPIFNSARYLLSCIESVLSQSFQNLEVLLIDDGSTDSSLAIAMQMSEKDKRIQVVKNIKNAGRSSARNLGISLASGDFIAFVDSDDELLPLAISTMVKTILRDDSDAVVGSIRVEYEAHNELRDSDDSYYKVHYHGVKNVTDELLFNFHASSCAVLFRKEIIQKFALTFPAGLNYEDAYFHWIYFSHSKTISFLPSSVYKYIRRPSSVMSQTFERHSSIAIQHLYIAERIFTFWQSHGELEKRHHTANRLLEDYFWFAFRYSQDYEKALVAYECSRIIRKFSLLTKDTDLTLKQIYNGDYYFLFPPKSSNEDFENESFQDYARFLKLKGLMSRLLPANTLRRRVAIAIARKVLRHKA